MKNYGSVSAMDEICIVQISDTHVCVPGCLLKNRFDSNYALQRAVEIINSEDYTIDYLLITGDLVEEGLEDEYAHLKNILKRLNRNIPVLFCLGNHDDIDAFSKVFLDRFPQIIDKSSMVDINCLDTEAGLNYCIDFQISKLIVLDSSVKEEAWGEISSHTLGWLEKILSNSVTDTNILALHHPPVRCFSEVMDNIALKNPDELEDLLLFHKNVQLIICGHVHRSIFTSFAGSRIALCPSVVFQYPIFMERGKSIPTGEQPGFHVHKFKKKFGWSTHLRLIT